MLHLFPHVPQLFTSVCKSVHVPAHSSGHKDLHKPVTHDVSGPQADPHWPQLSSSEKRSTQTPLQFSRLLSHESLQVPSEQTFADSQELAHAPQWARFDVRSTHAPLQLVESSGH